MLVKLAIDPDQIRWWCNSAIGSFETLDREIAIDMALADLRAILEYLDETDRSVATEGINLPDARTPVPWVHISSASIGDEDRPLGAWIECTPPIETYTSDGKIARR